MNSIQSKFYCCPTCRKTILRQNQFLHDIMCQTKKKQMNGLENDQIEQEDKKNQIDEVDFFFCNDDKSFACVDFYNIRYNRNNNRNNNNPPSNSNNNRNMNNNRNNNSSNNHGRRNRRNSMDNIFNSNFEFISSSSESNNSIDNSNNYSIDLISHQETISSKSNIGLDDKAINKIPETTIKSIKNLSEDKKKCLICLEKFVKGDKSIALPCIHIFHSECIKKWMKKKNCCPLCKNKIFKKKKK